MSDHKLGGKPQPEALASLAAASTHGGKKPDGAGLKATSATMPLFTRNDAKNDAAKKVLREGVLGTDQGAEAAIKKLPDRTKSRK